MALPGCSGDSDSEQQALVQGRITVADTVDNSGDFSGIGLTIIKKDSAGAQADTLFRAVTDREGRFGGQARFPRQGQYPLIISRNNRNLGQTGVILAEDDTVAITAELPGIEQTLTIESEEHRALQALRRVERSFQRVNAFARAGRLKGDSLAAEMEKWPGIFWQVYEERPRTLAGHLAAKRSVELLSQWDRPAMMQKLHQLEDDDRLVYLAATYGKHYTAESENLDAALRYLQTLSDKTQEKEARMRIRMERIDLLFDSARVEAARTELQKFEKEFEDMPMARDWAQSVEYDLDFLAPGDAIPDFSFVTDGGTVSREKLKGRAYVLELTSLTNPIYQQQYDRSVVIHSIYKNYDFEMVTIPLDSSQVTVEAFFEERVRPWPVAPAGAYTPEELIDRFNLKNLPTRFLVDPQGRIVRRYVGAEYGEVIQGIQKILNDN